jgi:hypothetical protein
VRLEDKDRRIAQLETENAALREKVTQLDDVLRFPKRFAPDPVITVRGILLYAATMLGGTALVFLLTYAGTAFPQIVPAFLGCAIGFGVVTYLRWRLAK